MLRIPRYLISHTDGENDFIVLEDVSPLGFKPASRQSCLNLTECTVILKTLAKFHAISFAYRDQQKEEFTEIIHNLEETYFCTHWDWYKRFHVGNIYISLMFFALHCEKRIKYTHKHMFVSIENGTGYS